jgi:hypothetical protein
MRSSKTLIPALLGLVVIGAFYFLVLSPKREEAAQLDTEVAAKQAEIDQSKALLAGYEDAKTRYQANYRTLARLGKAVTADDDVRSLLVQLSDAAGKSKVDFDSINVGASGGATPSDDTGASTGGLAPAPGTVPIGSAGFSAMPFSFNFKGNFFRLSDFFNRLEDFVSGENEKIDVTGRLLLVGSVSVTPSEDSKELSAQVGAASYLVPELTGVEGAAPVDTGAAPASSSAGGAATTPTTPTATITGVR